MDLDPEWKKRVAEKSLLEGEQREEKKYLPKLSSQMIKFKSLNKSEKFIKILKKQKLHKKYFTIYFDKNSNNVGQEINKCLNISFVTKKNTGNAVIRNKIKRRLKSAVQKIYNEGRLINLSYTYVIFGKNNVYKDKFSLVLNEINEVFKKIKQMDMHLWKY